MKLRSMSFLALVFLMAAAANAWAHCEIPCGIYDDQARADLIAEHIQTIEKSMDQVVELSGQTPVNYNQLVRWVNNKEHHANEIQHIVTQYFMTQRIKPDQENYEKKVLTLALEQNDWEIEKTADMLGIPRKRLYLRMLKFAIKRG